MILIATWLLIADYAILVAIVFGLAGMAWWWALTKWRKCIYETYLLADLQLWLKLRNAKKEPKP